MGKKANKASRKYAASGQLKKEIQARRKHQQVKRTIERRKGAKAKPVNGVSEIKGKGKGKEREVVDENEDDDVEMSEEDEENVGKFKGMSVDDFLNGGFMQGASDDDASEDEDCQDDTSEDDQDDNASFASVDDLEDELAAHKIELAKLAEKDPEFYKYLQENDKDLLDFDADDDEVDEDEDMEGGDGDDDEMVEVPVLTQEILRKWQKAILEHRSLKALRRLLLAFKSAAHMNDEEEVSAWSINSPAVYEKLVSTTLRYTPVVLDHHVPYKVLPDGKFKPPTQTKKLKTMQKMILAYFHNTIHLIGQLTDNDMLLLAVNESAKIVPYIISSRKGIKSYLKTCLTLWSSATDEIRIAAFLAINRLASCSDESIKEIALKKTYLTLLRSAKTTNAHTLPSINLMKNSASELFCADHEAAYQHAFGYIRQLAVHLRNSMKVRSKDAFKQVYNWQYVHCIDFWSIVLAKTCSVESKIARGGEESALQPLIYPLTQVALGAVKLITSSRCFPFHLNILRSLVHLQRHTQTYIPLAAYLLPIITPALSPSSRPKSTTLRPLDIETHIRAPAQYHRTRIYLMSILEEATYLLAEWLATSSVQGSIAFPEIVVPLGVVLKRALKKASGGKEAAVVKGLVERVEEASRWTEERRREVKFGPKMVDEVRAWERKVQDEMEEAPLVKYVKSQRKIREKRKKLVEKARVGEDETLEE